MFDIMANLKFIERFREKGLIEEWAVSGAIAGEIWGEPRTFQELEVIVSPSSKDSIDEMQARLAGMGEKDEYSKGKVRINGFTFKIVAAEGIFGDALNAALVKKFPGGMKVKVVRPEYLLVMFLEPPLRNEQCFTFDFCDYMNLDFSLISRIVKKHGKEEIYRQEDERWHFKEMRQQSIKAIWRTPKQYKHKVKYHRNNARQPLYKKIEDINICCSLYVQYSKIRMKWKRKEEEKK
ncbi:MAG TPA: hypothetical protein PK747_06075 [Acidobacteriota bacterium]|nr:hypothetical protein [Acidobacteriota bacterium]HNT18180.1 hypothetical protein [Acidobacteriota bacterium]HQO19915.1 hypothetical protein [Acidobacteriota bacterium]HQQ46962.1 hypothetical protein [Acidobacteriota bacterium]